MKILAIEGQGNFGFVKSQLLDRLSLDHSFTVERLAWDALPKRVDYDIVIGHSLGGDTAIRVANAIKPKALITLDPRHQTNLSMLDVLFPWQRKFKAPKGVKCFNFIHSPPLFFPGYEVEGAVNQKLFTNHFTLPGHKAVRECLAGILRENTKGNI